jgi:hypothetical protein
MSRLLMEGSVSPDVKRVQDALNRRMVGPHNTFTRPPLPLLVVDGIFGPKTKAMVQAFQTINQIKADGIAGPVTRLHLFPYLKVDGALAGRGTFDEGRTSAPSQRARRPTSSLAFQLTGAGEPKDEPSGPFVFELQVGRGIEVPIRRPWPPSFGPADQTVSIEATILRIPKLELSGELQASKPLTPKSTDAWSWEGSVKVSYEPLPKLGPITPLSPFFQLSTSALPVAAGVETKLEILNDLLELEVETKVMGYDFGEGEVKAGSISGSLKFNLDILFKKHPPAKP